MIDQSRHWLVALGVCTALTVLVFLVHVIPAANSMINRRVADIDLEERWISTEYMEQVVELHRTEPAFERRRFTTACIDGLDALTGVGVAKAFVIVQFGFLWLSGMALYGYAQVVISHKKAITALLAYFLGFSVLFAWHVPIYSYDEGAQYTLLFVAMAAFFKGRSWIFLVLFSMAALVRETSFFLLPGLTWLVWVQEKYGAWLPGRTLHPLVRMLPLAMPVVIFLLYHNILAGRSPFAAHPGMDLMFEHNFRDPSMAVESLVYFMLVIGVPAYAWRVHLRSVLVGNGQDQMIKAFVISMVINTVLVVLLAQAREARLFALPLLFLWPLLGEAWRTFFKQLPPDKNLWSDRQRWPVPVLFLFTLFLGILFVLHGFSMSDGLPSHNWTKEYMIIAMVLISFHWFNGKAPNASTKHIR